MKICGTTNTWRLLSWPKHGMCLLGEGEQMFVSAAKITTFLMFLKRPPTA